MTLHKLAALALIAWCGAGIRSEATEPAALPEAQKATTPPVVITSTLENGCDSCQPCSRAGARGGLAVYLIKPHFDNNPAFRTALDTGAGDLTANEIDFEYDYHATPTLWFGYVNDSGFGGRVRWFFFDQSAETLTALNTDNTGAFTIRSAAPLGLNIDSPSADLSGVNRRGQDVLVFESDLRMNVWDFEAMQELDLGRWLLLVTGGVRYAHISQNYNAYLRGTAVNLQQDPEDFLDLGTLLSGHNFNGAGPTASIAARRALGTSNLAVYAMGRGALLFGKSQQQSDLLQTRAVDGVVVDASTNRDSAHTENDKVVPVAELELGVDWTRNIGRNVLFAGVSLVGQNWFGVGNAANNEHIANAGGNTDEVSDNKSSLGLVGVRLAAGLGF